MVLLLHFLFLSLSFQQNPNLCTEELLASVPDVSCECFAFCDLEFVQCHTYPGGLLLGEQCSGTPVSGCNRAMAKNNLEESTSGGLFVSSTFACPHLVKLLLLPWLLDFLGLIAN
jgi:hypothetical protein